ncbi:MAG: thioesterase family protein [Aggregatilineales bacterium]
MAPNDRFVAEATFPIRYAETDAMGIVHHANYIVFFEEGRSHYARARGSDYADFERSGFHLVVTEVEARYLKAMHYGQRATVRCWIETMQSRSVKFGYEILDAATGEVCVTGFSKHICVRRDGGVAHLPEAWRAWGTG